MNKRQDYSEEEKRIIVATYSLGALFSLKTLALKLGRSKANICRYARQLGLTSRNRPKPRYVKNPVVPRQRTLAGFGCIGQWQRNRHPRGMLGKTHTTEYSAKISERMKREWADPKSYFNSEKHKQDGSDRMKAFMASGKVTNPYSRAKRGRRSDLGGTFFKSRWEANFARYLNFLKKSGNIFAWEYEKIRFEFDAIKRGTRSYLPDFGIWDKKDSVPYFYEVKGWMDKKSETRLKRMAKYHPLVKIIVIDSKAYREIEKKMSALIPTWEKKNDPPYDVPGPLPSLELPHA